MRANGADQQLLFLKKVSWPDSPEKNAGYSQINNQVLYYEINQY